ncbi:gfo/Idh/MocA family oxidoreductase [candidate division KSB1 bacterium]|nr:Gfo/Idh/MocA family oxidoreductase [candidate division KSB1 bacterium]RQW01149.1 MAG: gfo/Idh/MocA family oxidoreductase [candidate division KSB1 bacterium]
MKKVSRRKFIASASATAATFTIMNPQLVRGSAANSKIKLGLIGCGGRGQWIMDLFKKHGGYELSAGHDYFQDRVDEFGDKFGIAKERRFTGLYGYRALLKAGIDAVAIESPPYFHPQQAADAVAAGLHVYLAKPIAIDGPGCQTIRESGQNATTKNLCFLIDFQTRANGFFIQALHQVHNGGIGTFAFGEAIYHADTPFQRMHPYVDKENPTKEDWLRAWGLSRELSGDIITEQNIHTLDVMSWIMQENPLKATGTCGHLVRDKKYCHDYFSLVYEYPNNIGITFSSKQFNGHGTQPEGIRNRMFGSKGVLETEYGGRVLIRGENFYKGGDTSDLYPQGARANIETFYKDIQNGNYANPTVEPSVQSNLITVMGRTAAYEHRTVTWEELIKNNTKLEFDLSGLKQ